MLRIPRPGHTSCFSIVILGRLQSWTLTGEDFCSVGRTSRCAAACNCRPAGWHTCTCAGVVPVSDSAECGWDRGGQLLDKADSPGRRGVRAPGQCHSRLDSPGGRHSAGMFQHMLSPPICEVQLFCTKGIHIFHLLSDFLHIPSGSLPLLVNRQISCPFLWSSHFLIGVIYHPLICWECSSFT